MKIETNKILTTIIIALLMAVGSGVWKFYYDWVVDEATEENLMFDNPEQKLQTVQHPVQLPAFDLQVKMKSDSLFQARLLEEFQDLKKEQRVTDSLVRLNVFLTNKIEEGH